MTAYTDEQMDAYRTRARANERRLRRLRHRNFLTGRTLMWHVRRRFPNIAAMERERNDWRAELVQDRNAPVREVIAELGQDIAAARASSWPLRFQRWARGTA